METTQTPSKSAATNDTDTGKVHQLLKDFPNLMVVTFEQTGTTPAVRARPMAVAKLEDDCTLWFITSRDSSQVVEATGLTAQGHVIGQSRREFVSLQGTYDVLNDRAKIEALWSKAYEVWFPEGPQDPSVCLLRFLPREAEVWDASGTKGLKYLFASAKALLTGETPKPDAEQHKRIALKN